MNEGVSDLLRVEDLRVGIGSQGTRVDVVNGVSFRIPKGKTVALVGESGSGKSIIAQTIMGILPDVAEVTGGSIKFYDPLNGDEPVDIVSLPRDGRQMRQLRGGRISIIFQEPMTSLSPVHTVGNQIDEALYLHRDVTKGECRELTEQMLELVGFPDPSRAYDMYSMELSGGLRQRAMIAMALVCNPALLIADEPTTALDVTVQAQVLAVLKDVQRKLDMSLLLITHDLGVVANMADEILVLYHGAIMEAGTLEDIFHNPTHPYLKALLAAVPKLDMEPGEKLVALREVTQPLPESFKEKAQQRSYSKDDNILTVRNLSKSFESKKGSMLVSSEADRVIAVDNVSFKVRYGECFGLVGESGCGKTSISKLIMRAITPSGGSILFNDGKGEIDLAALHARQLFDVRRKIQMVFQDPFSSLSPRSTVLNILSEPLEIHGEGNRQWRAERARELMSMVGLSPTFLNRYPHSFSGGQRQRIGIARALALDPDLLICDEPVSALDVSVQAQILNLLIRLQKELNLTSIFISHNLAVVNYVADRVAVMRRGRIVEIAPGRVLFQNPVHPYTLSLLQSIPTTDLACPLALGHADILSSSASEKWDERFIPEGPGAEMQMLEVGEDHYVLVRPNCDTTRLVA
ncbi:ABC transporter ATP-binding protein [Hoeflea prorocentri]|uniref:ABC transporter ATP-binding protein n=1 Tax=Hoeflea prorocentri TaxID=1922333 RepID=A0A9X3UKH2_9HYPH|nr:ABC transporter ATP-binding protein [Hoeflea prorocentri]MCY6380809.1 ABC transporter ATP-binding protein [Hoeflea prorocentri]MDA5398609.1 ABC transporter ATP-binding protein [Hoeflea prorocentri]